MHNMKKKNLFALLSKVCTHRGSLTDADSKAIGITLQCTKTFSTQNINENICTATSKE